MRQFIILFAALAFNAHATKGGLLTEDASILGVPKDAVNSDSVPNPKIQDITLMLDRTNQDMTLTSLNATQAVFDKSDPFSNVLVSNYVPNKIIKVRVREFMGTLIELPEGDTIKLYKLGDTSNFSFKPSISISDETLPSSGHVEVTLAGADTALHVIGTSGNIYTFYLRGDTWNSPYNPTMKVILKDDQLLAKLDAKKRREETNNHSFMQKGADENKSDFLESVEFDPSKIDFGYRIIGGNEELRPYMVYSDGQFTYFRFAKGESVSNVKSFPAIYRVADGSDVPTNTSAMGSTLRVEGVANNWTLRLGTDWLCIEKMTPLLDIESSMNSITVEEKSKS